MSAANLLWILRPSNNWRIGEISTKWYLINAYLIFKLCDFYFINREIFTGKTKTFWVYFYSGKIGQEGRANQGEECRTLLLRR